MDKEQFIQALKDGQKRIEILEDSVSSLKSDVKALKVVIAEIKGPEAKPIKDEDW